MPLETATYIDGLNATNPIHATDDISVGDDHIRLLKATIQNTFPNISGAVNATQTELGYLNGVTGVTGSGNLVLSAAPTFTGTLTAAAITATTYGGIAEANLVDKSAAETVTGAWDFDVLTATSYDGIAAANLLDKTATETVSGFWTFSASAIEVTSVQIGHPSDSTLSRRAAGNIEIEGRPIIAHNDTNFSSGRIFVSTAAPSGGSDGDIWLRYDP